MNITINSKNLDYRLEAEATVGEVVDEIEKWLGESGMCIRSIDTNGEALNLSLKSSWNDISVHDIDRMDIVAQTPIEFRAEKIESLHQYFVTLRDASEDAYEIVVDLLVEQEGVAELLNEALSREMAASFTSLSDAVLEIENAMTEDAEGTNIPSLNAPDGIGGETYHGLKRPISAQVFALSRFSADMVRILETRWREITDPEASLRALMPIAIESIRDLSEVSAYLQTGQDSQAMQRVLHFLEVAQSLMRILYVSGERKHIHEAQGGLENGDTGNLTVATGDIADLQSELGDLLEELSTAITEVDTITIGDLLEYEIGPRFLDILDALGSKVLPE